MLKRKKNNKYWKKRLKRKKLKPKNKNRLKENFHQKSLKIFINFQINSYKKQL